MRGNAAVIAAPLSTTSRVRRKVRIRVRCAATSMTNAGRERRSTECCELRFRVVLGWAPPGHPLNGRVEMRAGVFTARDVFQYRKARARP